jgi:hypothetical protein
MKNGSLDSYDHPIIRDFKEKIIEIMKESNPEVPYTNFTTKFVLKFNNEIKSNTKFKEYQIQKSLDNISKSRRACIILYKRIVL